MKKLLILAIILIFAGAAWAYRQQEPELIKLDLPPAQDFQEFETESVKEVKDRPDSPAEGEQVALNLDYPVPEPEVAGLKISEQVNLDMPFSPQAPTANWEQPFQDACEEASVLMVDYYYQNKDLPDKVGVEKILTDMVDWQMDNWGGHWDLPIARVAKFAEDYLHYRTDLIDNLTADKIRQYLDKGLPVIVPADGRILDNPFFTGAGPDYHMLVIKGYVDDPLRPNDSEASKFITNDPGTKRGADFVYTEANLMSAIFDWDEKKSQTVGPKVGLVLYKN